MTMMTLFRHLTFAGMAFAVFLTLFAGKPASPAQAPDFVRGRLLVKFRPSVTEAGARGLLAAANSVSIGQIGHTGVHVLQLPNGTSELNMKRAFAQRPEIEFAELDKICLPADFTPNDPS